MAYFHLNWPAPQITTSSGPIQFVLNGGNTTVSQDTVTPSNSIPLPVAVLNTSGVPFDPATETTLLSIDGKLPASLGQTTMSASLAVAIASDQSSIPVTMAGLVDTGNSSTAPLAGAGVFTGSSIDITNYASVQVSVATDVASATNGLSVQYSSNGTNWDHKHEFSVPAGGISYSLPAEMQFMRIVYTNGASAQAYMRLETILKSTYVPSSEYTVSQAVTDYTLASVSKSVIYGKTTGGGGGYVAVKVNPSGALTTESTVTNLPAALGQATMANSLAVAIASDQSSIPVAGAGAAGSARVGNPVRIGATYNSTLPTYTNGQTSDLQTSERGELFTSLANSGFVAGVTPYGYQRVTTETNALFSESFDTLDTTNKWTLKNSGGSASVAAGFLTVSSSTGSSAYGGLFTIPTFVSKGINFTALGATMAVPTVTIANTYRFWGFGNPATVPTVAIPITNGAGFEIDGSGNFNAVTWSNSIKTNTVSLASSVPTSGVPFYCAIAIRPDRVDYYVNNQLKPVATILLPAFSVQALSATFMAINDAVAPASAATMQVFAFGMGDTGANGISIADGNFNWRTSTVKPASTAAAATDTALVVGLHPSSPIPTGTNSIGNIGTVTTVTGVTTVSTVTTCASVTAANLNIPGTIADVASAAITSTTTTAAFTPTFGASYQVVIPVTAVTGTSPTLDVQIQISNDSGTNWTAVYDFPRITGTGFFQSPIMQFKGNRVRYVQTVGGGTPSFTRAINRLQSSINADPFYQMIDRTIVPNTLNSTSTTLYTEGASSMQVSLVLTALTTAGVMAVEGSDDNVNWYDTNYRVPQINGTTTVALSGITPKFMRLKVYRAASGATLGYVELKAFRGSIYVPQNNGKAMVTTTYNDYSSANVTTSAYTQLISALTADVSEVEIFDSSGEALILATGAAASEVDQIYIFPGGNGRVPLKIAANTRVSIKAKTANATSGFSTINFYGLPS